MHYDIAIVGAGPAGTTLARLLNPDYKVLLLDRRDLLETETETRDKCCGGLLAPDAQELFGRLGMALPRSILVDPQIFTVRTLDFDNQLERYYRRFYFNMDRKRFDEWIASMVPEQVDLAYGCMFNTAADAKEGMQISFIHGDRIHTAHCSVLVAADGAYSRIRNQLFPDQAKIRKYITIQEWFPAETQVPHFGAIFDSSVTDFYSWTITKDNMLVVGAALKPDAQADERFSQLKEKLMDTGYELGTPIKRHGAYLLRPEKPGDILLGNERIALVGEAAGFISPSSAEGISYAISSAYALAQSLNNGLDGFETRYRKHTAGLRRNIRLKHLKSPFMYNKTLRGLVMKSGLTSSTPLL